MVSRGPCGKLKMHTVCHFGLQTVPTTRQKIQWLDGVVVVRFERGAYFYMFGTDDATPSADCTKLNIPLPTPTHMPAAHLPTTKLGG
jgi:hypothetical protein